MNKEQEYIKFWTSIVNKIDENQKDYNNLSDENKSRADMVKDDILRAHSFVDIVKIIRSQMN